MLRVLAGAIERGVTNQHEYERLIAPYVHYERRIIQLTRPTPPPDDKKIVNPILYFEMGAVKPMGVSRRVEVVHPVSRLIYKGPKVVYLRRFARLPKPTRSMWTGNYQVFAECSKIFAAWGYVSKKGRAASWSPGYTLAQRLEFADQFDPDVTPRSS